MSDRFRGFLPVGVDVETGGFIAATDAVLLAAACPAVAGQSVLDLGCGAGAAALCLAARVPEVQLSGLELQPAYAALARRNAAENGIQINGDIAITMGNVYLTNAQGQEVVVDKTFVFRRGKDGKLRLCTHKSALPFVPTK